MPFSDKAKFKHIRQRSPKGLEEFYTIPASHMKSLRTKLPKGSELIIATNPKTGRTVIQSKLIPKKRR